MASPLSVQPSGFFRGIDGPWSTFNLAIGTAAQNIEVLASTLTSETWVVAPGGCPTSTPIEGCRDLRGNFFRNTTSTSWSPLVSANSNSTNSRWSMPWDSGFLGGAENYGYYGYDVVRLIDTDGSATLVTNQVIAAVTDTDYFVGSLGLQERTAQINSQTDPSLLRSLRSSNVIPSASYSFTAGSHFTGELASLVFGGMDTSRFEPNDVNFTMAADAAESPQDRQLSLAIQRIESGETSLLSEGITTFIDSTLPNIWLPTADCGLWEEEFGLRIDPNTNMYTVSTARRLENLQRNASITFTLGQSVQGGPTVDITFPYSAFDLNFTNPGITATNTTYYFPLRQADSADRYVLGRSFLQRAYLSVNYEWRNFSISQALPGDSGSQSLVALPSSSTGATDGTSQSGSESGSDGSSNSSGGGGGISGGAIAGIVIGVLAVLAILFGFLFWRRRQKQKANAAPRVSPMPDTPNPDMHEIGINDRNLDNNAYGAVSSAKAGPVVHDYFSQENNKGQQHEGARELESPPPAHSGQGATSQPAATSSAPYELQGPETSHEIYTAETPVVMSANMTSGPSPNLTPHQSGTSPADSPGAGPSTAAFDHQNSGFHSASTMSIQRSSNAKIISHVRGNSQSPSGHSIGAMTPTALSPNYDDEMAREAQNAHIGPLEGSSTNGGLQRGGSRHSGGSEGTLVNTATDGGPSPNFTATSPDDDRSQGGMSAFVSPLMTGHTFERTRDRNERLETERMVSPEPEPLTPP